MATDAPTTPTTTPHDELLVRIDVYQNLDRVEISRSDWTQAGYARWTDNDEGTRVLRVEPLTLVQVDVFEDAIKAARHRFVAKLLDDARKARREAGQ